MAAMITNKVSQRFAIGDRLNKHGNTAHCRISVAAGKLASSAWSHTLCGPSVAQAIITPDRAQQRHSGNRTRRLTTVPCTTGS